MISWKSVLKADPTDWLLEIDNPSVRYGTLTAILKKPEHDLEVLKAKKKIMTTGLVPAILANQHSGGYWGAPDDFYIRSKYKGTVWTLLLLAELGAAGHDTRIRKACEFILAHAQDNLSGGFAYLNSEHGGDHTKVLSCLTGNMIWSLIKFGYLDDPRIQQGIDWITTYQRFDDKIPDAPKGWPYERYKQCWGTHTCHMGVVKSLKALANSTNQTIS